MPIPRKSKKEDGPSKTPVVRLAVSDDGMPSNRGRYKTALAPKTSTVRLVAGCAETRRPDGLISRALRKPPPVVRLACAGGQAERNGTLGEYDDLKRPALLVSYYYLLGFQERQKEYAYRDWMMDSGAFSAYNSGKVIDLQEYIDCCHKLKAEDPTLSEIIALDVIGSGEGSLKNAIKMKDAGVEAMPVFHIGDDWGILKEYAAGWDKVGLSCRFGEPVNVSLRFYEQCFARIWPKKCHSFGWVDEKMLMRFPFHSSDSSTWETGPCGFANWKYFGKMSVKGSSQNLRSQVLWYLDLEDRLRQRWKKEMALLDTPVPLSTKLVVGSGRTTKDVGIKAINGETVCRPKKRD